MAAKKPNLRTRQTRPELGVSSGVRRNIPRNVDVDLAGDADERPLDGMRVLWIDADRASAAHGRAVLEAWGSIVLYAAGAAEGLDTTAQAKPDCVVISLPHAVQVARTLYYMIPGAPQVVLIAEFTANDAAACPGISTTLRPRFESRDMLQAMMRVWRR